ncbi:hypothetical protein POVWA2_015010 [Plasmodium ovale wallikeri]|uniref:Uncharacterized protein n=1 Tax=Plasmodium ovale wallikeri TaxID=864142 RepID=A0A1A8YQY1_PLAOA|nr:hypothetical protein POVWA2_015010 [Plasmodium ovale wallikeri]SBT33907.1 hypothetical protein POVWA1_019500 [Plasmodium ovale wallikeri]
MSMVHSVGAYSVHARILRNKSERFRDRGKTSWYALHPPIFSGKRPTYKLLKVYLFHKNRAKKEAKKTRENGGKWSS